MKRSKGSGLGRAGLWSGQLRPLKTQIDPCAQGWAQPQMVAYSVWNGSSVRLRRVAIVVIEQATKPLATLDLAGLDFTGRAANFVTRLDELVFQALVISLVMIMFKENRSKNDTPRESPQGE